MINIRFHIVSLVAVFLALGVGVTMGASFIDRATVDSMRGRVDDLEAGFRERGDRLDKYRDQMRSTDDAAAALSEPGSRAIDGMLDGQQIVVITPTDAPDGVPEEMRRVVTNAGATVVGTVELQPALAPSIVDGELPSDSQAALQEGLGDAADANAEETAEGLLGDTRTSLAEALAELSADPPGAESDTNSGAEQGSTSDPTTDAALRADSARELLARYSEAGLLSIDGAGLPPESAFPAASGVRYLVVAATGTDPSSVSWVLPFAQDYGAVSSATMLVGGVTEPRSAGDLSADPDAAESQGDLLEPLRTGGASDEVTTVESATEPLALLAVVYGLSAQLDGVVGHYGIGAGVTTPYPILAQE